MGSLRDWATAHANDYDLFGSEMNERDQQTALRIIIAMCDDAETDEGPGTHEEVRRWAKEEVIAAGEKAMEVSDG